MATCRQLRTLLGMTMLVLCWVSDAVYDGAQRVRQRSVRSDGGQLGRRWSDDMLYSPLGQRRDSYQFMPLEGLGKLSVDAQQLLVRHQFPASCKGKKFLVSHGNDRRTSGLGSHLHISGSHLGIAIEQNRIFVWGRDVLDSFTDDATCGSERNVLCFFQAPTNCTWADVDESNDVKHVYHGMALQQEGYPWHFVPNQLRNRFAASGQSMLEQEMKYWWRGQSVAFLMRFNDRSITALKKLRTVQGAIVAYPNGTVLPHSALSLSTMRPGTVSIHIRHGDKHKEMQLVPTGRYLDFAEALVVSNPLGLSRRAFVSTEDPAVFDALMQHRGSPWQFLWYDMPRINSNGLDQIEKLSVPAGMLTLSWFLQILVALECDAWVGTRGSNWNRLIDELRCTWVPKCAYTFSEVGVDTAHLNYDW